MRALVIVLAVEGVISEDELDAGADALRRELAAVDGTADHCTVLRSDHGLQALVYADPVELDHVIERCVRAVDSLTAGESPLHGAQLVACRPLPA